MIAEDMPVQIRRCGTMVPVQRLAIGDLLYDPLCDNYIEIHDILSRSSAGLGHALARIPAGRLGRDLPRRDILLSRQQLVARAERPATGKAHVGFGAALHLGEGLRVETRLFALFPERPGCISVAGAILRLIDTRGLLEGGI